MDHPSSSSPPAPRSAPHSSPTSAPPQLPLLPEIAFFDVETTVPSKPGQGYALLEFGAIIVCPRRLVELGSYSTLIRPTDPSAISATSIRCNGITRDTVEQAPSFVEVADSIYSILHGRVWAGHNIVKFDCARIREAFAEIGRPAPEPKGLLDSYPLLTNKFGRRAGNMKMATLAAYFGLGQQKHRSLEDVRMNVEVLKYCATVLFLESSLSDLSSPVTDRSPQSAPSGSLHPGPLDLSSINTSDRIMSIAATYRADPCNHVAEPALQIHGQLAEPSSGATLAPEVVPTTLEPLLEQMETSLHVEANNGDSVFLMEHMETTSHVGANTHGSTSLEDQDPSSYNGFLEASSVLEHNIHATAVPTSLWGPRVVVLHKDAPLQLSCRGVKILYGVDRKYVDRAGRPKLSIVLDAREDLRRILTRCEAVAKQSFLNSGGSSEWRPLIKEYSYPGVLTTRLNIPTSMNNNVSVCASEIYQKDACGNSRRLSFNIIDGTELDSLLPRGTLIDAYFSVETYDYQQFAGLRLVAKCLTVYS